RLSEQPVAVGITDPSTGQPVTLTVDREELGSMLFTLLYVPDLYRHVPALLSAAADGDLGPLVRMAHPVATGTMAQIAGGLRWSVVCNEDVPLIDGVEEATAGTFWGRAAVDAEREACAEWPQADVPADYFEPFSVPHPVLILSGTVDPVTPPRWGELLEQTLPNAQHVRLSGASHMPAFPGCTPEVVRGFLEARAPVDARCAEEASAPQSRWASASMSWCRNTESISRRASV